MAIYEFESSQIQRLDPTSLATEGIKERADLQRLLRENIAVVSPDTLVIDEEFSDWQESRRRIDLLGIDKEANLIVVELKRAEDAGHMELQAIRYAAMVSTMTFEKASAVYQRYLQNLGRHVDASDTILRFLEWDEPDEESFAQDVKIVLVAAEFSRELTTTVIWLNTRQLDLRCVRVQPYRVGERLLLDVQQIIPLPEAADYQIAIREKEERKRSARGQRWDEPSLLNSLIHTRGQPVGDAARELIQWIRPRIDGLRSGSGEKSGGLTATVTEKNINYPVLRINSTGKAVILVDKLKGRGPFAVDTLVRELRRRIGLIPGAQFPEDRVRFRCDLKVLVRPEAMESFKQTCDWLIEQIRSETRYDPNGSGQTSG